MMKLPSLSMSDFLVPTFENLPKLEPLVLGLYLSVGLVLAYTALCFVLSAIQFAFNRNPSRLLKLEKAEKARLSSLKKEFVAHQEALAQRARETQGEYFRSLDQARLMALIFTTREHLKATESTPPRHLQDETDTPERAQRWKAHRAELTKLMQKLSNEYKKYEKS